MTRLEANREIVKLLSQLVEQHPDFRFGEILTTFTSIPPNDYVYYEESVRFLKTLKECVGKE